MNRKFKKQRQDMYRFLAYKHNNQQECFCAEDECGNIDIDKLKLDMENPVDFQHQIYICKICGKTKRYREPNIELIRTDHPIYSSKAFESIAYGEQNNIGKLYCGYGLNNEQWDKTIQYAVFNAYNYFVGIGRFVGIINTVISTAGDNPSPPIDIIVPLFELENGKRVSMVGAIPTDIFLQQLT